MSRAALVLRPASPADTELLLRWANDDEVREASFSTATIDEETHRRWLAAALARDDRRLWIAELDGAAVGQVRLDLVEDVEVVSVSVDRAHRGRGLGPALIVAACERAYGPVFARIRPENARSLAAFAAAGFERIAADADAITLHWQPDRC